MIPEINVDLFANSTDDWLTMLRHSKQGAREGRNENVGFVNLRCKKSFLTPQEARKLAQDLLFAADEAELDLEKLNVR